MNLPPSEITPTETTTSTTLKTPLPNRWAYIVLEKWSCTPVTYVGLTEEEVALFPALQTSLQAFEGSKRTEYWYKTFEQEAQDIQRHIWEKYKDKYSCEFPCVGNVFEYQRDFYSFSVALP